MEQTKNPVVLCQEDFKKLSYLLNLKPGDKTDENTLAYEVQRAIIVKDSAFPANTIRLNSAVTVMDMETRKELEFVICLPNYADARSKKISVLTPMGAAIIGFRIGDEVEWRMPAGMKRLKILDVRQPGPDGMYPPHKVVTVTAGEDE